MARILVVDDEKGVLNALRRELQDEYEIETFISPLAALQRSREVAFDLVISDYQMPEMNGIQFLGKLGEIQPDTARMVLSGQADIRGLLAAINESHIYRFIAKPWDAAELKASIAQALSYRKIALEGPRLASTGHDADRAGNIETRGTYRILLAGGDEAELKLMQRALSEDAAGLHIVMHNEYGHHGQASPQELKLEVESHGSAAQALEQASHQAYDLAIAADPLPDMDCIGFLVEFRKRRPDAACILISAEPDMKTLEQAINALHVDRFLDISWVSYELKADATRRSWNMHQLRMAVMQALLARDNRRG